MSVIIRLQNLPWSANSLDIRHYFRGLSIPEGGVHIVGGEMGDAFIAFSTDEDARQAMMLAGGKIKEVQISLMLSSRNEMQKVIEAARQASMTNSLAQLLGTQNVPPVQMGQQGQVQSQLPPHLQPQTQQHLLNKDRRELRDDKKDSSDMSTSSYDTVRRDKKEKSRSRSRDRMRKDRRDRDRDRERRRRSRSRSRSRDRRRRRSHSRSRGRDNHGRERDRKDVRDDMKKEKDMMAPVNSLQDATNLPNLDILNPNQWRMINPANLPQNAPVLNSITNLDILRNFAGAKPLLPAGALGGAGAGAAGGVPMMGNVDMNEVNPGDRFQGVPGGDEMGYGTRGRGGDFPNGNPGRRDRDGFKRDHDMNGGNPRDGGIIPDGGRGSYRNLDDGNAPNFQGNYPYGDGNLFDMTNNFGGFQHRNNDGRYGNFNSGDGYSPMLGNNREPGGVGRGLMDYPLGMANDGFKNRNDRFDNQNRDDRVDEFGRSIQLRNRKKNSDDFKEEDFPRNPSGNFPFSNRFANSQSSGPQPLLRSRESWPPGRGQGDGFSNRRGFRGGGGFDEGSRGSFRNDFQDVGSRFQGRSRRDDFHSRDRGRFSEKTSRDDSKYERDCCVEIRGLAPNIAYGDVRRPFNTLKVVIKDIKFLDYTKADKKCRLKFLNYENKKKALQNPKKIIIEGKQVQLLHINDSEFDECTDEGVKRSDARFSDDEDEIVSSSDAYLQVTDLAPDHVEADIGKLLSPAALEKVVMECSADGSAKTALVKFSKPVDAKVALGTPSRKIGEKSVTLAALSQRDFNDRAKKLDKSTAASDAAPGEDEKMETDKEDETAATGGEEEEEGKSAEPSGHDSDTDCIVMKNLPFEASDRDICDFFSDIGLVPKRIHLMLDSRGQPSGDAYCEFSQGEQALTACSKNGMPMGKNNLVVQQVTRAEVNDALGVKSEAEGASASSSAQGSNPDGFGKPQCVVALENIPFRAGVFDIINFFGWSYKLTEDDIFRRYNDRGQPTGDARVSFRSPEDAVKAVRFLNNRNMMGRVIRMKIL